MPKRKRTARTASAVLRVQDHHHPPGEVAHIVNGELTTAAPRRSSASRAGRDAPAPRLQFRWADAISKSEWTIYSAAIDAVRDAGIPFLLGGGFALATFIGRWRDTKDIDFYIMPEARQKAIAALSRAGFVDYFDRLPYDRKWIYRSVRSGVIIDIIWSMANRRARVDELWFRRAGSVSIRGEKLAVVPPEEFIWCKLYILQRDHCDWTDIFNVLHSSGPDLDWKHLLRRLEGDLPLLRGALSVYGWLCPRRALQLPQSLWKQLRLTPPALPADRPARSRIRLLDSRAW